ncbi:MAG: TauD/TfdA family dioxygenase [Alphaproteobacteria bacterium]|nr:TauD/TfdA family dioxygenase [Alphaproteobacteria bacterium]
MNGGQETLIREEPILSPMTWVAETMLPSDGLVPLEARHLDELRATAEEIIANPLPIERLVPELFEMPACRALMAQVRKQLDDGIGFAIIDRLPVDDFDTETVKKLYWLLMNMTGQTVAQSWDGTMVYDIVDTKKRVEAGNGVRSSKTNLGQNYHVDNAFNLPPDFVALFCLQTAIEGGVSGLISFETVYNRLLDQHRAVIPRLYQPFHFDRQQEHAPDGQPTLEKPMVEYDGKTVAFNFNLRLVEQGYDVAGIEMDEAAKEALELLDLVTESSGLGKTFGFERGQIQITNNRQLGHRRTAFTDHSDPARRRHLVRTWIRDRGRPFYLG